MSVIEHLLKPHTRDLGDFAVSRLLPAAATQTIGPFIFFDHMGPVAMPPREGADVRPHPHIGLATVTYLFEGEILHHDSLGSKQVIRPGDVNWMTAGKGIAHSERSPQSARDAGPRLHGIQTWVALPKEHENVEPSFHHHPAAKHAMPVRKALGFPTIFNLLGPLTNPAGAGRQIMGVYADRFVRPVADTHARLGAVRALVFHAADGLDEFSIDAPTHVADVRGGVVEEYEVDAQELGLRRATFEELQVRDLDHAAALVRGILDGSEQGPPRDMTLLNAAAALVAADRVESFASGVGLAAEAIDSGATAKTLSGLIEASNRPS